MASRISAAHTDHLLLLAAATLTPAPTLRSTQLYHSDLFLTLWSTRPLHCTLSQLYVLYLNPLPLFSILTFLLFSNSSVTDQHQHCRYFFPSKTTFFPFASMRCWSNPTLSFNSQRRNTSLIKRHQQREAREGRCPGRLNNERLPLEEASTSPGGKSWILCALYSLYVKYTQCQPIKLCNDHLSVFTAGEIVCLT